MASPAPPPPYTLNYAVTYSSTTDSFVFTFASTYSPISIERVHFTYFVNSSIPNGVTFYSELSSECEINDGLTVSWSLCTAPSGAVSALDLYNKILALYTGGGGSVAAVTGTSPVVITGTSTNPNVTVLTNVANGLVQLGAGGKIPANLIGSLSLGDVTIVGTLADLYTQTGLVVGDVSVVQADPTPANNGSYILTALPISTPGNWTHLIPPSSNAVVYAVNGYYGPNVVLHNSDLSGTIPVTSLPALSLTGDVTGTSTVGTASIPTTLATVATPGTYAYPSSITINAKGLTTSITAGSAPGIVSLSVTAPITSTGGTSPTIGLATTGITAGTYTMLNAALDVYGRVTSAVSTTVNPRLTFSLNTLDLAPSGVTPGTYPLAKVTVDTYGRTTAAVAGTSADIIAALGYTPANSVPTGWSTTGNALTTTGIFGTTNGFNITNVVNNIQYGQNLYSGSQSFVNYYPVSSSMIVGPSTAPFFQIAGSLTSTPTYNGGLFLSNAAATPFGATVVPPTAHTFNYLINTATAGGVLSDQYYSCLVNSMTLASQGATTTNISSPMYAFSNTLTIDSGSSALSIGTMGASYNRVLVQSGSGAIYGGYFSAQSTTNGAHPTGVYSQVQGPGTVGSVVGYASNVGYGLYAYGGQHSVAAAGVNSIAYGEWVAVNASDTSSHSSSAWGVYVSNVSSDSNSVGIGIGTITNTTSGTPYAIYDSSGAASLLSGPLTVSNLAVGGVVVANGSGTLSVSSKSYYSAYSTSIQAGSTGSYVNIAMASVVAASGFAQTSSTVTTCNVAGTYEITCTAAVKIATAGTQTSTFTWYRNSPTTIAQSAQAFTVGAVGTTVVTWSFVTPLSVGDTLSFGWITTDAAAELYTNGASASASVVIKAL